MRASILAEEKTVDTRLDERLRRADAVMAGEVAAPTEVARITEKKARVVRDTFSMPVDEHAGIAELQARALRAGVAVTRSQLVRAGLRLLQDADNQALKEVIAKTAPVKQGRSAG